MKVAFWNVTLGTTSFRHKIDTFVNWCNEIQPDLLILEEVGETMHADALNRLVPMTQIERVATLDKNGNACTKDLVALRANNANYNFECRAGQFPELEARRLLLKVTCTSLNPTLYLWGIHANASTKGGHEAVSKVAEYLKSESGKGAIVGGDFNCPITSNRHQNSHAPLRFDGIPLEFTQWNKQADNLPNAQQFGFGNVRMNIQLKPNSVLDYVMSGEKRQVNAERSCINSDTYRSILHNFDHCPVVYSIT